MAAVFGPSCTAYPVKAEETALLQTASADMNETEKTYDQNKIPVTSVDEPSGLRAVYGQKLSDIQLPDGWEWSFPSTILQVNNNGYEAYLTVTDDDIYDYSTVPGYDEATHKITRILSVTVAKADCTIEITTESMDKVYDGAPVNNPSTRQIGGSNARRLAWYQKDVSGEWTALASAPVNAGNYKVTAVVEGDANFNGAYTEKSETPEADKKAPSVSISAPASVSVKTGDTTNIFVWTGILALSGIGALCTIILKHRRYQ